MSAKIDGFGVGLRRKFAGELPSTERRVDWLEMTPENWVRFGGRHRRMLDACAERWPIVPHSVSLSIGGPDPLDESFLREMDALCRRLDAPWWSDHVCWTVADGQYLNDLFPLPFSDEAVEHTARRIAAVQERVGCRLALENATFYAHMPGGTMDEAAFLRALLEAGDCGLLLDVNNIYVNCQNHGGDARAFIDRMPMERVWQIHVAGHTREGETIIDTHIGPVIDPVWELYRYAIARAGRVIPTLLEWDQEIPSLDVVLDEVDRARAEAAAALATSPISPASGAGR